MKSCSTCDFGIKSGGDIVPYGGSSAYLPTVFECDCPEIPEEIFNDDEKMLKLMNSNNCSYWSKRIFKKHN